MMFFHERWYVHITTMYILQLMKWGRSGCMFRRGHPVMFLEKGVLKICSKFTGTPMRKCDFNKATLKLDLVFYLKNFSCRWILSRGHIFPCNECLFIFRKIIQITQNHKEIVFSVKLVKLPKILVSTIITTLRGWLYGDFQPAIIFIIFWDFLMFYQIILSPQVKRWAIITYKHGIYKFPHELPNNVGLELDSQEIRKYQEIV